jgi:multicomponent Na+:H+ antiporter subunit E
MPRAVLHHVVVALGLFALWVVLSGMLDAFHLVLGALSAIGVSALSARRLYTVVDQPGGGAHRNWLTYLPWHKVFGYLGSMGWEILRSNLSVAKKVLGPTSLLTPQVFHLKPALRSELARVVLANSIILTPGTTVLDVTPDGDFVVHAVDADAAKDTAEGPLQERVAWAFEPPEGGGWRA